MTSLGIRLRGGAFALAAACLLFLASAAWTEDKPATTTTATAEAPKEEKKEDPHAKPDPIGATNGTDLGPDAAATAKGGDLPIGDLYERDKDGAIKKDDKG